MKDREILTRTADGWQITAYTEADSGEVRIDAQVFDVLDVADARALAADLAAALEAADHA